MRVRTPVRTSTTLIRMTPSQHHVWAARRSSTLREGTPRCTLADCAEITCVQTAQGTGPAQSNCPTCWHFLNTTKSCAWTASRTYSGRYSEDTRSRTWVAWLPGCPSLRKLNWSILAKKKAWAKLMYLLMQIKLRKWKNSVTKVLSVICGNESDRFSCLPEGRLNYWRTEHAYVLNLNNKELGIVTFVLQINESN